MGVYGHVVRPVLFRADPEWIHDRSIRVAERLGSSSLVRTRLARLCAPTNPRLNVTVAGLSMNTPLGMAAGYDKNARATNLLSALGFGHVEIGSVSADPSAGNPRPRLFRQPDEQAIIVAYGVPNDGADRVAQRLAGRDRRVPVGVNVVNTNRRIEEPPDVVIEDYVRSVRRLDEHADYLCLNLSCPNTRDGQSFSQNPDRLRELLTSLTPTKPVFLKVAPFDDLHALDVFLDVAREAAYVVGFSVNLPPGERGAVAGRPAEKRANDTVRELFVRTDPARHAVIGSGGVFTAQDAYRKIRLGASLVQLFTSLVYRGPGVVRSINEDLARLLERDGVRRVSDVVGIDA